MLTEHKNTMTLHSASSKPAAMRPESIRLPEALREFLRAEARKNTRSFSGEIVHRLEASRQAEQQPKQKGQHQ